MKSKQRSKEKSGSVCFYQLVIVYFPKKYSTFGVVEAGARLNTAEKNKKCIRPILEELKARRAVYRTKLLDLDFPKEQRS